MDIKDDIEEDIRDVEALYFPLVKLMVKELIAKIPLKSVADMKKYRVEIYGYLYIHLKGLPVTRQKIVTAQVLGELDFALLAGKINLISPMN